MNSDYPLLLKNIQEQYSKEEVEKIIQGFQAERVSSFRINSLKATQNSITTLLKEHNIPIQKIEWYPYSYTISDKYVKEIKNLDIYQNGEIYFQSLSSMLPVIVLDPQAEDHLLDMTAAPGSKTTQIAMHTGNKIYITACEKNKIRLERLKYNLQKQGVKKCTCLNIDATKLDSFFSFDKILLDAPCSGSGTINIRKKRNNMFTDETLNKLCQTQLNLLRKALTILKKGQTMVYSTCSILKEENENIIATIQKEFSIEIIPIDMDIPFTKLTTTIPGTLCICPDELFEGFFIAHIRKIS